MRPRSLGRLISITSTLRARLSVPVSTKRKTHPIHDPPAGNLPDRSYGSRRHPPNLWALPVAIIHAIEHRLGEIQEAPHQVKRQIGARRGKPVDDHRPLQIQVFDEVPTFVPVDERARTLESRQALADLRGDSLTPGVAGQFEAQATLRICVVLSEVDENGGQALST